MSSKATSDNDQLRAPSERKFGLVFAAFFAIVGLLPLWHGGPVRLWALVVGTAFLIAAVAMPRVLAPLNAAWMRFGELLHHITSPILLGAVFFLSVTPIAMLMRARGKDVLSLRKDPKRASYWIERDPGPAPETMKNQF